MFYGSATTPIDGTYTVKQHHQRRLRVFMRWHARWNAPAIAPLYASEVAREWACLVAQLGDLYRAVRMLDACRTEHSCHLDSSSARWHSSPRDDDKPVPQSCPSTGLSSVDSRWKHLHRHFCSFYAPAVMQTGFRKYHALVPLQEYCLPSQPGDDLVSGMIPDR
jgi:hypothetical protein